MAALLAAAMAAVAAYCAARLVVPAWRDAGHPVELDVLHVVMGAGMVAMLLDVLPGRWHTATIAVFGGAAVWCLARSLGGYARRLYARFAVVSAGMLAMLVPHVAVAAESGPSSTGSSSMPGMSGHHMGIGLPDLADLTSSIGILALVAMMTVALSAVLQLGEGRQSVACRLGVACEIAMATSMGYMLAMGL